MSTSYLARILAGPLFPGDTEWHWRPNWRTSEPVASGVEVSPDTADRLAAVFACVRVITETAAMLPLHLYRRKRSGGKDRATDHPLYNLLHSQPNPWQSAFEFWEMYLGHLVLRGQAFAQKIENGAGEVISLVPLHPNRVTPAVDSSGSWIGYNYQPSSGPLRFFRPDELMRTLAFSRDGVQGRSVIEVCREAVGVGIAAEQFGASFLGKGVAPNGIFKHPGKLSEAAFKRLTDQLAARAGTAQAGKTLIAEEGMDWVQVGMKLTDAQYIELRRFSVSEMARLFRVPPHMIMDLSQSTNNNIEHQGLEFTTHCEMPWLVRLEQTIWRDLLSAEEQADYFAKFNVDSLLRGDLKSRYEAFAIGRQWGWLSADDVLELEDRNPLPDGQGEIYLVPLNMVPADAPLQFDQGGPAAPTPPTPPPAEPPPAAALPASEPVPAQLPPPVAKPAPDLSLAMQHAEGLLREPLHRLARRELQVARDGFKRGGEAGLVAAVAGHREAALRTLPPVLEPCAGLLAVAAQLPAPSALTLRALVAEFAAHLPAMTSTTLASESATQAHETTWPAQAAHQLATALLCTLYNGTLMMAPAA